MLLSWYSKLWICLEKIYYNGLKNKIKFPRKDLRYARAVIQAKSPKKILVKI